MEKDLLFLERCIETYFLAIDISTITLLIQKKFKIQKLIFFIIFTVTIAAYSNQKESLSKNQNNDFINNIYFKKTLNEIVNNLEPRYEKYNHKIKSGETFDKILSEYSIERGEIIAIKESISKKFNINKLNTNQKIEIILDKTNNKIKKFMKDQKKANEAIAKDLGLIK